MKDKIIALLTARDVNVFNDALDLGAAMRHVNSFDQINPFLYALKFRDIGDLCRAYSVLDYWRLANPHVSMQLNPFDGADDDDDGYYLYIQCDGPAVTLP